MVAITQFVVAGLMTVAVQALPQQAAYSSATSDAAPAATSAPASGDAFTNQGLLADLLTLPTAVRRFQRLLTTGSMKDIKLVSGDDLAKMVVFPFQAKANATKAQNEKDNAVTAGGVTAAANIETFPILTGLGISTTLGFMEPCGINTPHVHPRATEFLTVVSGKNVRFGYVLENGLVVGKANSPEIAGKLDLFEGTVFPQGSIHFQFNDNCDPAVFVAGLNSEDPGTNQIAQGFFALNDQVVNATLGFPKEINGKNIAEFRNMIPANLAQDMQVCLNKCNKKY